MKLLLFPSILVPILAAAPFDVGGAPPSDIEVVLTLQPEQTSFAPGEFVGAHVKGLPFTFTVLGVDVDPGPTVQPYGILLLGMTPSFYSLAGITNDNGCYTWMAMHDCGDPVLGVTFYMQAIQLPVGRPPLLSNGVHGTWEDLTGVCNPPDLCQGGGVKPAVVTMRYTGEDCSASSHGQDPAKVTCSGDPAFAPVVHVIAHDPSYNHVWFEGDVALGATFELDAAAAGETRLKGDTEVEIYDASTGVLLQSVGFHTSCSEPLRAGDRFGSLELMGLVVEGS